MVAELARAMAELEEIQETVPATDLRTEPVTSLALAVQRVLSQWHRTRATVTKGADGSIIIAAPGCAPGPDFAAGRDNP